MSTAWTSCVGGYCDFSTIWEHGGRMSDAQSRAANAAGRVNAQGGGLVPRRSIWPRYGGWKWGQTHAWMEDSGACPPGWQVLPHHLRLPPCLPATFPAVQIQPQPPPLPLRGCGPGSGRRRSRRPIPSITARPTPSPPTRRKKVPSEQAAHPRAHRTRRCRPSPPGPGPLPCSLHRRSSQNRRRRRIRSLRSNPTENETAESKALPKPAYTPGDLAEAKPDKKVQEKKGTSESENGADAATQPEHERPRTLAEARERAGAPGPLMRQEGGVKMVSAEPAVDAMRTVYGDYDRDFIDAVESRWFELLKDRRNSCGHGRGGIQPARQRKDHRHEIAVQRCG
jgi:hypothetical protein